MCAMCPQPPTVHVDCAGGVQCVEQDPVGAHPHAHGTGRPLATEQEAQQVSKQNDSGATCICISCDTHVMLAACVAGSTLDALQQ